MRLAAIDTGSNSIKLLICETAGTTHIKQILFRYTVSGLSKGMAGNMLSPDSMSKTAAIIRGYLAECQKLRVDKLRITATAWARKAANAGVLLDNITACGYRPSVIDGCEEARLTWLATAADYPDEQLLVFNIGGGSTEFICGKDDNILLQTSLPIGAGQLSADYLSTTDCINIAEYNNLQKNVTGLITTHILHPLSNSKSQISNLKVVLSGGTGTNLAQIARGANIDWDNGKNASLSSGQLYSIEKLLCAKPLAERLTIPGISPDRADVLPAGTAIAAAVARLLDAPALHVTNKSLAHGIVKDMQMRITRQS